MNARITIAALATAALLAGPAIGTANAGQTDLARQYKCSQHVPAKHVRGYLVEVTTARGGHSIFHVIKGAVPSSGPGWTVVKIADCRR